MAHVFLSYSHRDDAYVAKLALALEREGIGVWVDNEIYYGARFTKEIRQHLDGCDAVVLIMSPAAEESEWVANEVERARRKGKPVLPLLLQGDTWLQLETVHHVDVRMGQLPPRAFYDRLRSIIAGAGERPGGRAAERYEVPVLAEQIASSLAVGSPPYRHGHPTLHVTSLSTSGSWTRTDIDVVIVPVGRGFVALAAQRRVDWAVPDQADALELRGWGRVAAGGPFWRSVDGFSPKLVFPALTRQNPLSRPTHLNPATMTRTVSGKAIALEVATAFSEIWGKRSADVSVDWRNHLTSMM